MVKPKITANTFEWGSKTYRIQSIESNGNYIDIVEDTKLSISKKLEVGRKTPNFTYLNVFNVEHSLKKFNKQQVYLFFWDKKSITQEDTLYLSKLHHEFGDFLKLITLNHGDQPKQVKISFYYDHIKWPVGYSNSDIAEKYYLENVPRGYYLDKHRRLINDQISPKDMYELMNNGLDS